MSAMGTLEHHLKDLLEQASAELPEVTQRRMFSAAGFFVRGKAYCMVWDGRIVLKVADDALFAQLLAMPGATRFQPMPGATAMGYWVCVSEALHDDLDALRPWVEHAHRLGFTAPAKKPARKPARKPTSKPTKKPAAKRAKTTSKARTR